MAYPVPPIFDLPSNLKHVVSWVLIVGASGLRFGGRLLEARVLLGATQTLSSTERILTEINQYSLRKADSSPEKLSGLPSWAAGFTRFTSIAEGGIRRFHQREVVDVLATK
jgi:hypothetical protein